MPESQSHNPTWSPSGADRTSLSADLLVGVLIVVLWQLWFYQDVTRTAPVTFDTFRDAAAAENVLAGQWFSDPAIAGQPFWYAPLGPIAFAGISRITGAAPLIVYAYSILWLNFLAPLAWYAFARRWSDRWTALVGAALIIFGSRWWTVGVAMPTASTQGAVCMTLTLIAWSSSLRIRRRRRAVAVGVLLAACTWLHIVSGIVAAGTIGLHALWCASAGDGEDHRRRRIEAVKRMALIAATCAIFVAPLAYHLMRLDRVNRQPIEYLSKALLDPVYALQSATPLVPLLALAGLFFAWRERRAKTRLLLAYAAVGLAGQAWGYLRILTDWRLPALIPHEFQWNFQIATGLLAAYGLARLAAAGASLIATRPRARAVARAVLTATATYFAVGAEFHAARALQSRAWHATAPMYRTSVGEAISWIKEETSINDVVFAPRPLNYMLVGGATGRKLVGVPVGQANIAVDAQARIRDAERLATTLDALEFAALLAKYDVKYVLLLEEHEKLAERWRAWSLLAPAFRTSTGTATILKVIPKQPAATI